MNGHELAKEQIINIANNSNGQFELVSEDVNNDWSKFRISIVCSNMPNENGGYKLRSREEFIIKVQKDFPYSLPSVDSIHKRFYGLPHVQWGKHICLYRSIGLEWNVEKGLYGFIHRLLEWLEKASSNSLSTNDIHIHPPANANSAISIESIIPSVDCPKFEDDCWIGFGLISNYAFHVYELVEFKEEVNLEQFQKERGHGQVYIPVFLSKCDFPYDYPETASDFFQKVVLEHFEERQVLKTILKSALSYTKEIRFFVCFGTLMRRRAGETSSKSHLTFWELDETALKYAEHAKKALDVKNNFKPDVDIDELKNVIFTNSKIKWAEVMENRPEIITPRDEDSLLNFTKEEKIVLLGCGALGSNFADTICRAGADRFELIDNDRVTHGVLCRQNYKAQDVGFPKAIRLANFLKEMRKGVITNSHLSDFTKEKDESLFEIFDNADTFINSTGSNIINFKLEQLPSGMRANYNFSTIIDGKSQNALFVGWHKDSSISSLSLNKYLQQVLSEDPETIHLSKVFWPKEGELNNQLFEPEPGCSEPTFQAGVLEVKEASAALLRGISTARGQISESISVVGWVKRNKGSCTVQIKAIPNPEEFMSSCKRYRIIMSKNAKKRLIEEIENGYEKRGKDVENGGVVLGQCSDFLNIIWIDRITDAPLDSKFNKTEFICGTSDLEEKINTYKKRFNDQTYYLGTWHTHPDGAPSPSGRDLMGAQGILEDINYRNPNVLFLIVGDGDERTVGFHVFKKEDLNGT